ncbi:MAG: lysophospholipid acyltransferase family protein [Frankia sp.]
MLDSACGAEKDSAFMGRVERRGFWIWIFVAIIKPLSLLITRRRWSGRENVPRTGGVIFAANHVSYVDPVSMAHFVYWCRRIPRFMAKSELFTVRVLGRMLRGAGQIPVYRRSTSAGDALRDAVTALEAGRAVVIYPEGTITQDPDHWPMVARTGVARLALLTGAPVVPVAQWGAHEILGRDKKVRLLPRRVIATAVGQPVDLSAFRDDQLTAPVLRAATEVIMDRVREQLGVIRGEDPPDVAWNPRTAQREGAKEVPPELVVPDQPVDDFRDPPIPDRTTA